MACGKIKVELLVKEVLGPLFGNDIVKIIKLKIKSVVLHFGRTKNDNVKDFQNVKYFCFH